MINFDLIQARVYVGSAPNSKDDIARLKQLKVSALISLQSDEDLLERDIDWSEIEHWYLDNDITAKRYPILDFDEADMTSKIGEPIVLLQQLLSERKTVYIHCNTGVCRAPAVVLGYLCHFEGMSIEAALRQIQIARPIASPYRTAVRKAIATLADHQNHNEIL